MTVASGQETTVDVRLEVSASPLDAVVVTGTVVPTEVKALPTPISIVTAEDIQRQNLQRVDQVFRGQVPGAVAWDQGPGLDFYSSVNVRGASNITATPSIKTFIDGVEVADAAYIATIDPNSVDRIEIVRGPQASTLYGAGALSGVMQIFTKKGQLGLSRPEITATVSGGGVGGLGGQSTGLETDNRLSVLGGAENTSYNLSGSYRHMGEWVPSYHSTDWSVSAGGQTTQGLFTLSSSARYANKTFDSPWDTRFQSYTTFSKPPFRTNSLLQQTYGVTASFQATRSWQQTLTLGYDRSDYNYDRTQPAFTTPADSFLYFSTSQEAKTSILYHTDVNLRLGTRVAAILTAGANHDAYDFVSSLTFGTRITGNLGGATSVTRIPWTNTGYFGQVQLNIVERLFLTGGLRAERNPNFGADFGTAWSPRIGTAYVMALGPATVKVRASYGESIRAPFPGWRDAQQYPTYQFLANANLAPERQRGADGGVEVYLGTASVGVTYYNQRAIDLIQLVTVPDSIPSYQYQNIARAKNEGWEVEGRLPIGAVQLAATYSITNSTVQALPQGYPTGGLQVGDRILGIPHTSAGASVTYSPLRRTTLTAGMTLIGHWIEHDWVAEYGYFYGGQPYRGSDRAYWIEYPTVTKFAVGVRQELMKDFTAFVRAENVGNTLRSEQTNVNIPVPRTVIVGGNIHY